MSSEGALRRAVERTHAEVDALRAEYQADPTSKATGRRLLNARRKASDALEALWEACPDEKPPTQRLGV